MNSLIESIRVAAGLIGSADATLLSIVGRSLQVSLIASLLACAAGAAFGAWLGSHRFRGRGAVLLLLNTYVAIPAVVVGLIAYLLLSRSGPLGFLGWLYTVPAMVFAQTILVFPLAATMTRQTIEDGDQRLGESLRSMGANTFWRPALLLVHERHALVTMVITCFGRAIAEVGTVMMVGGNIDGFTRVMTTAIALETSKGDLPLAIGLGIVLLATVLLLNMLLAWVRQPRAT